MKLGRTESATTASTIQPWLTLGISMGLNSGIFTSGFFSSAFGAGASSSGSLATTGFLGGAGLEAAGLGADGAPAFGKSIWKRQPCSRFTVRKAHDGGRWVVET